MRVKSSTFFDVIAQPFLPHRKRLDEWNGQLLVELSREKMDRSGPARMQAADELLRSWNKFGAMTKGKRVILVEKIQRPVPLRKAVRCPGGNEGCEEVSESALLRTRCKKKLPCRRTNSVSSRGNGRKHALLFPRRVKTE